MSLTIKKSDVEKQKKERKENQKSKNKIPKPSFVRSPSELSPLLSSPLSPSPPHPSIPIIRYIHTYLICTVYESSSHSSSSASKVGCRSSAGGDYITHTHTRRWKACTQAKVYGTFDTSYPLVAGVLVVWLFGRLVAVCKSCTPTLSIDTYLTDLGYLHR